MNRKSLRGISAVLLVGGGVAALSAAGVEKGAGAVAQAQSRTTPVTRAADVAVVEPAAWNLPNAGPMLKSLHKPKPKPKPNRHTAPRASRSQQRAPLTGDPRAIGHAMMLRRGWSDGQWACLDALWTRESGWQVYARNAGSGAYGIPQALPADKLASAGADWRTNPVTQISWGLTYISESYGTPCAALRHSDETGYY